MSVKSAVIYAMIDSQCFGLFVVEFLVEHSRMNASALVAALSRLTLKLIKHRAEVGALTGLSFGQRCG